MENLTELLDNINQLYAFQLSQLCSVRAMLYTIPHKEPDGEIVVTAMGVYDELQVLGSKQQQLMKLFEEMFRTEPAFSMQGSGGAESK